MLWSQTADDDPLTKALQRKRDSDGDGTLESRVLAAGDGWRALDVVCTAGPRDRPFAERHELASISLVVSGTFAYRSERGTSLLARGALLLGNSGNGFECSHRHGEGDRCISFQFDAELFDRLAHTCGASGRGFSRDNIPPLRTFAPLIARAAMALARSDSLEEIGLELASSVLQLDGEHCSALPGEIARVARVLRELEHDYSTPHQLTDLAALVGLSRYHFLRTFKRVAGITPHQWMIRTRLREAARRCAENDAPITEIAYDVGFDDLSNFIRSFRAEFGCSPRAYRASARRRIAAIIAPAKYHFAGSASASR